VAVRFSYLPVSRKVMAVLAYNISDIAAAAPLPTTCVTLRLLPNCTGDISRDIPSHTYITAYRLRCFASLFGGDIKNLTRRLPNNCTTNILTFPQLSHLPMTLAGRTTAFWLTRLLTSAEHSERPILPVAAFTPHRARCYFRLARTHCLSLVRDTQVNSVRAESDKRLPQALKLRLAPPGVCALAWIDGKHVATKTSQRRRNNFGGRWPMTRRRRQRRRICV